MSKRNWIQPKLQMCLEGILPQNLQKGIQLAHQTDFSLFDPRQRIQFVKRGLLHIVCSDKFVVFYYIER
jgi:hypothetical protein